MTLHRTNVSRITQVELLDSGSPMSCRPYVRSLRDTNNIASALPGAIQGAITIPRGFFECLRMLIIPRNSLKFRLLVDSNATL